jgi:bacteriocin biosynthesis cyclodehydratase domain-containing protein
LAFLDPQLIRVSDELVVVKRGVHEILISGPEAGEVVSMVIDRLSESADFDAILESLPYSVRSAADRILRTMRTRNLLVETARTVATSPRTYAIEPSHEAFFAALDADPEAIQARLLSATLVVYGLNRTSLALVRTIIPLGIGAVQAVSHPVLDNYSVADEWSADFLESAYGKRLTTTTSPAGPVDSADLVVATSDWGRAQALLDINRSTVATATPFLPVWLDGDDGFLGPLVITGETACLRCVVDSRRLSRGPGPTLIAARLNVARVFETTMGPVADICGCIAAMEALKFLTDCAPSAVVGQSVEANQAAMTFTARRVLKFARCPDCSDIARHRAPSVMTGPQIPNR